MKENFFNIRYVSEQTGLSQDVIRIWERRYGAVQPQRTETDRRRYSEEDLQRLRLLKRALDEGHSIGAIAKLSTTELIELVPPQPASDESVELQRSLKAIHNLDPAALTSILNGFFLQNGSFRLMDDLISPLMVSVGQLWESGKMPVSAEHMASGVIRGFLETLLARTVNGAPDTIVVATPAGEWHELGALAVSIHAAAAGWNVMYLGANLPAVEIGSASDRLKARAIALSLTYAEKPNEIARELKMLRKNAADGMLIFAGGSGVRAVKNTLLQIHAVLTEDMAEFRGRLAALKS